VYPRGSNKTLALGARAGAIVAARYATTASDAVCVSA
jgi:hypothetical protein